MITLSGPATCSFCFTRADEGAVWFGFSTPGFSFAWQGGKVEHRPAHVACLDCGPLLYGHSWRTLADRMVAGYASRKRAEEAIPGAREGHAYSAAALALRPDDSFVVPGFRTEVITYLLALGRVLTDHVPLRVGAGQ